MIAQQQQQWFYSTGGERVGPVGFDYLLELAKSGKLDPRADLVWSSGLNDWEPAGEVEGLFEKRDVGSSSSSQDTPEVLSNSGTYEAKPAVSGEQWPGTGRIGYIMGAAILPILLTVGWQFVTPMISPHVPDRFAALLPSLAMPVALLLSMVATVKRLHNLSMTGWWLFGFMIPFLNIWLGYRCIACPAGFATVKKLDLPGKLIAFLYWGSFLAMMGLTTALMVGAFGELKESGFIQEILGQFGELREMAVPER